MAFGSFDSNTHSGRGGVPTAEINMVPLIDVMLVLVVIFIVAAPLATHSVKLNLPKASTEATQPAPHITLSLRPALQGAGTDVFWDEVAVPQEALPARFQETVAKFKSANEMPEIRFFVDEKVPHGVVAKVMAMASRVGLSKLVFVNQPEAQ